MSLLSGIENVGKNLLGLSTSDASQANIDPFSTFRPQAVSQLNDLMSGNYDMSKNPTYQAEIAQGAQTTNRQAAANGSFNSGNRMTALANSGAQIADQTYQQQFSLLSILSGNSAYNPSTMAAAAQAQQSATSSAYKTGENILGAIMGL
jgi:hypothetical protein